MAIVQNFWLKGAKKRLAGAVIYKAGGQTIQRALAESVSNPRTRSQMVQRVRWANMVNFYKANREWMKYAYETKKPSQSEYNKLMSLNVATNRIYLTKQAAASGACVVDEYVMTQGSLPSITYNYGVEVLSTNLYLPDDFSLTEGTTVAELARALVASNPGIQEGDQISIIRYTQMVNEQTGYPYVIVRKYEMLMDFSNVQPYGNYWPHDFVVADEADDQLYIAITNTGNAGGLLMVLSRTIGGKTYVSTQSILPVNNSATINSWSSDSALNRAINSYGESEDAFLSSDSANYAENEPIQLVPLSVSIGGITYAPNEFIGTLASEDGKPTIVTFNQDFEGAITHVYIDTDQLSSGTIEQQSPAASGPNVSWNMTKGNIGSTALIRAIRIQTSAKTYRMDFSLVNPGGGSLE